MGSPNLIKSIIPNTKASLELPRTKSVHNGKRNILITEEDALATEPAETRFTTRVSPTYQSVARSPRGRFGISEALETSPKSVNDFSAMLTNMNLPKGDDELVFEEESNPSTESPMDIMNRRINEYYAKNLPNLDKLDLGKQR